jgi:hypothetical protein
LEHATNSPTIASLDGLLADMERMKNQMFSTNQSWQQSINAAEYKRDQIEQQMDASLYDQYGNPRRLTPRQATFNVMYRQSLDAPISNLRTLTSANPAYRDFDNYRRQYYDFRNKYNEIARKYRRDEIPDQCPRPLDPSQRTLSDLS